MDFPNPEQQQTDQVAAFIARCWESAHWRSGVNHEDGVPLPFLKVVYSSPAGAKERPLARAERRRDGTWDWRVLPHHFGTASSAEEARKLIEQRLELEWAPFALAGFRPLREYEYCV